MELFPHDLGDDRYLTTMRHRLAPLISATGDADLSDRPIGRLRRRRRTRRRNFWVRDLQGNETREKVKQMLSSPHTSRAAQNSSAFGLATLLAPMAVFLFLVIALMWDSYGSGRLVGTVTLSAFAATWGIVLARQRFVLPRRLVKNSDVAALTEADIEAQVPAARGRLERTYFNLVRDAMRLDVASPSAQEDVRNALRSLGDTISRLPADAAPSVDTATLHDEINALREQAARENDAFVKASFLRQADALSRRATLAGQNATSARRLAALRSETRAQMNALRAVLTAMETASTSDTQAMAHLGEALQRVSGEAQAVSVARRELEDDEISALFGAPLPDNLPHQPVAPAAQTVKVPAAASAPQQTVGKGKWWNGSGG